MIAEKEYFAFISYQREDEKWAKWLADELEHYHLPTTLNGKDLPKNLRPIFRDVDELSAGNLPEQIYQALSISKNLIVICSPRAKSEWVDKEIEDFIKIKGGKVDNIYPFIIEGIPFSKDDEKECYPKKLRNLPESEERLGGNINEQGGRNAAAVKIIAGMLGVGFDALWQKYEREKRRKRNMTLLGIISFAVVALGIALWMWHLNNQISTTNRQLVRENICINSRDVINLLENGKYVDAKHQMQSILDLWNKEYQQDIPEMEKALRALYRYQNRDGIVKLYSLPLSDKQQFLSADSDYLYIHDTNGGKDRIISYAIDTGDSARQVFPKEGQMINFPIYDCRNGIVICESIAQFYQDDGVLRYLPDTICIYDLKSGKKIMEKNGYLHTIILNKENVLIQQYDTLSKSLCLEVAQTNNGHVIQKWLSPCKSFFRAASLNNDSLIVVGEGRIILYHVKSGKMLSEIDYGQKMKEEIDTRIVCNSMINKSLKQFVIGSNLGLRLFNAEKHNIQILDRSDNYGPMAFNPSGTMLAAVKYGNERKKEKDSILIYAPGVHFPIYSVAGDDFGNITFANDNLFVEGYSNQNRINVYSCEASFSNRELYSQTGRYYAWLDRDDRVSIVIFNDSTEETIDVIRNSKNRISRVYGFSPQDTYLVYSTTEYPLILHHIPNKKNITIPISWNDVRYNSFDFYISDNEKKLLRVIHSYTQEDYIALYDIGKDIKEIFNIVVTQDKYHPICYALSANGSKMALTEGSKIYVHKTDSFPKDTSSIVINHIDNSSVRNICFFKGDSQLLAASYSDGTIRFWDTITGEQRYSTIYSEAKNLISLDISGDAQYLIGTSKSDYDSWEYLVWHIPSGLLIDRVTNAWSWWANSIIQNLRHMKPYYRASFAGNSNEIIVNEHNFLGLSRKFGFPTFDELIALYTKSLLSE